MKASAAVRVAAIVFGLLIAIRFLWIAHAIFIITFLGVLVGLAMARAVDFLERAKIKRGLGAPLVLLAVVGVIAGIGALIGPSIARQSREVSRELPQAARSIEQWLRRSPAKALLPPDATTALQQVANGAQGQDAAEPPARQPAGQQGQQQQPQQKEGFGQHLGQELRGAARFLFPMLSSTIGIIGGVVVVLFIAMYIAAEPRLYRQGILHLVPHKQRDRAGDLLDNLADTLRRWLVARLIAMVAIGLITGFGLALLDVKGAAALGVLAGLLEFIPFFGPIVSAVPALGIALVDSPGKALSVGLLYLVLQQLEGNVITPLLLQKRLDIPPVLTVVTVAALGMVFGVMGMLIAEPLLAVVLVSTKMLYVNDVVGDDVKIGKASD